MNWSANVLSTVTSDTEPTIIIEFDSAKYIFNVGENTNRAFIQGRPNWKKTKGIFLTSVGAQRASGLADMFSVKPMEVPVLAPARTSSSVSNPVYKDDNVTIYALPVLPNTIGRPGLLSIDDTPPSPGQLSTKRKCSSHSDTPLSSSKRLDTSSEKLSHESDTLEDHEISVEELSRRSDFEPAKLQGRLAEQWRELIVRNVFVQSKPTPNQKADKNSKETSGKRPPGKGKKSSPQEKPGSTTETTPAPIGSSSLEQGFGSSAHHNPAPYRVAYINGFNDQLPPFSLAPDTPCNTVDTKPTLVYAVIGPRVRGKFDAVKAKALQIPNGVQRRNLTLGQSITFQVTNEDGQTIERTVKPEDVIGASEAPSVALVLDIPTRGHISSLISSFEDSPAFARFLGPIAKNADECSVRTVFHICGEGVLEDSRYVAFMNRFEPDVQHVISSRQHSPNPVSFTSAAFNQLRLSQLDSTIFRIPKYSLGIDKSHQAYDKLIEEKDMFHPAAESQVPLALSDATAKRFQEAKNAVLEYASHYDIAETPGSEVIVTPLGTSSAVPTKYRNVSSTLIRIPNYGSILLDTGEGTWGQFARHFGTSESVSPNVWDALRELKCIYISHIHADHHGGLAKILAMRSRLDPPPTEPLYLIAHSSVFLYIHEYANIEELGLDRSSDNGVKCILSDALHVNTSQPIRNYGDDFPWLSVPDFSGDTIPSDRLAWAGKGATLLIHEASMGDDAEETAMAKRKRHSTFGQAVDIGRRMSAENILLTHFSARYPQMPPSGVPQPQAGVGSRREPFLALAFDNADIKIGDVWKMNMYLQAIEQSFLDTAEEGDDDPTTSVEVDVP
ncbi:hypothetical protein HWV62_16994 [Athelia sp. TMB]|nr:hypothetical protein HWV62_16994 [Athelia sp. TMB]